MWRPCGCEDGSKGWLLTYVKRGPRGKQPLACRLGLSAIREIDRIGVFRYRSNLTSCSAHPLQYQHVDRALKSNRSNIKMTTSVVHDVLCHDNGENVAEAAESKERGASPLSLLDLPMDILCLIVDEVLAAPTKLPGTLRKERQERDHRLADIYFSAYALLQTHTAFRMQGQ